MPGWFSWFAEYQPFSPATETLRGLLLGSAIGTKNALLTVGWCLALTVLGYVWSRSRFTREPRT
jgi:ABC-2 type transport system permease protein